MKPKFCVFAGTAEGRTLVELLTEQKAEVTVCCATEYGAELLPSASSETLTVLRGRLTAKEMAALMAQERFALVLDATHPYAGAVTENVAAACAGTGTAYLRVRRPAGKAPGQGGVYVVPDAAGAVELLNRESGNVLLTTGSKALEEFSKLRDFSRRVWARVLPVPEALAACRAAGLPTAHILAMQGPFTRELNAALLRSTNAAWMVTKDGGELGGFGAKAAAARDVGASLVVLGRPTDREGLDLPDTLQALEHHFDLRFPPHVTLAGLGPGGHGCLTPEVRDALDEADCLLGAQRLLDLAARPGLPAFALTRAERLSAFIHGHPEYRRFVVALSGDPGFYSGARSLLPLLADCSVRVLPGLSSLNVLCARAKTAWEDVETVSLHGRPGSAVPAVRANPKVFALTGGPEGVSDLCRQLLEAGLDRVHLTVGERLGYPEERITEGSPGELAELLFDSLSAVLIQNPQAGASLAGGLPDTNFHRMPGVPMTKREVRAVVLSRLAPGTHSVCWDVGAGTGSVSVELALLAKRGAVYAVERRPEAREALMENCRRFGLDNVVVVPGEAPEACRDLPAPDQVFLGGVGLKFRETMAVALEKNPWVRIVATAATLESLSLLTVCMRDFPPPGEAEAVCITVARDVPAGRFHRMEGNNPVWIFSFQAAYSNRDGAKRNAESTKDTGTAAEQGAEETEAENAGTEAPETAETDAAEAHAGETRTDENQSAHDNPEEQGESEPVIAPMEHQGQEAPAAPVERQGKEEPAAPVERQGKEEPAAPVERQEQEAPAAPVERQEKEEPAAPAEEEGGQTGGTPLPAEDARLEDSPTPSVDTQEQAFQNEAEPQERAETPPEGDGAGNGSGGGTEAP